MTKKATSEKLYNIYTDAMLISQSGVEQVTVEYDGKRDTLHVVIGETWSVYVPLQHDEFRFQLNVVRHRLDRLMDRMDLGRVA